jgi:hypothetical protein
MCAAGALDIYLTYSAILASFWWDNKTFFPNFYQNMLNLVRQNATFGLVISCIS